MTKAQQKVQAQIKKIEKEMWFIFNLPDKLLDDVAVRKYKELEIEWKNLIYN